MVNKAIAGLVLASLALIIGLAELDGSFNKGYGYVLVAGVTTAFLLSMATITGGEMAARDDGVVRFKIFGNEVSLPAKTLTSNSLLLIFVCALAMFGYKHHTDSMELSQKIYIATEKNTRAIIVQTWVMTLSQEKRERLNLDVPEEIRQMQRHREP